MDNQSMQPTEEQLHERLWAVIERLGIEDDIIRPMVDDVESHIDENIDESFETHLMGPSYRYSATKLLDMRRRFTPGTDPLHYYRNRWTTRVELEQKAWNLVETMSSWDSHEPRTVEDQDVFCSMCGCNVARGDRHRESCAIIEVGRLLEFRSQFPEGLTSLRETITKPPAPRPSTPPIRRAWKNHYRPPFACRRDLIEHLPPRHSVLGNPDESLVLTPCSCFPTGSATFCGNDPNVWTEYETCFGRCIVSVHTNLPIGLLPVISDERPGPPNAGAYATKPGVYETWLWRDQAENCRNAGCSIETLRCWAWSRWTTDNRDWTALLDKMRKQGPLPTDRPIVRADLYDIAKNAEHDNRHAPMVHWFSYALMQIDRSMYRRLH